jgi:hypothetical protein
VRVHKADSRKGRVRTDHLDAIANGMHPWRSKFSGILHDERWLKGVEEAYLWTAKNQQYLTHQRRGQTCLTSGIRR